MLRHASIAIAADASTIAACMKRRRQRIPAALVPHIQQWASGPEIRSWQRRQFFWIAGRAIAGV